ncbi:MarR family transcriptional regulator [Streptomyces sp. Go40/10]|uniref:MarR family winged helix-turn-helix transcriptional regulator n=1 Tax=Streptomyces sp. Go40/10 TaxID=2825844 RepID=UPI001E52F7EE|nr:MarR family transcriptional regulator [Streptomyces sp. Go40/10]UFR01501.1 MarR family transcriptional regulator [Streptomyces sp. Go40/10]
MTTNPPRTRRTSPSRDAEDTSRRRYFATLAMDRPDIALCRATTVVARAVDAELTGYNVTAGQHLVLKMLSDVGPCSQQELSEQLRIDRSVMVGCIDGLENSGLVRRERHPKDRRANAITLTAEGLVALAEVESGVPRLLDRAFQALTPAERKTLARLVAKILEVK